MPKVTEDTVGPAEEHQYSEVEYTYHIVGVSMDTPVGMMKVS